MVFNLFEVMAYFRYFQIPMAHHYRFRIGINKFKIKCIPGVTGNGILLHIITINSKYRFFINSVYKYAQNLFMTIFIYKLHIIVHVCYEQLLGKNKKKKIYSFPYFPLTVYV